MLQVKQNVKQQNREYELGKKQNELTGRGQDITYDLGLKDVGLRNRGYDLQEVNQNRDYELGLRSADQGDKGLTLQEQELAQQRALAEAGMFMDNPNRAMNLFGTNPVQRDAQRNMINQNQSFYAQRGY